MKTIILGGGLAGCLAGVMMPDAEIWEASESFVPTHQALLRFRSDEISKAIATPFRHITVRKSIWVDGEHHHRANAMWANWYSRKCLGAYASRSIWNLEAESRWIAPHDLHDQLAARCAGRLQYGRKVLSRPPGEGIVISTLPMPVMAEMLGISLGALFRWTPVHVLRSIIRDADIYQTIYYPEVQTSVYRASITGDRLIVESTALVTEQDLEMVLTSFGVLKNDITGRVQSEQKYGKLVAIDDRIRRQFIFRCTSEFGIYSLGRAATWRNVLMDDVYTDLFKVREMMDKADTYELFKRA